MKNKVIAIATALVVALTAAGCKSSENAAVATLGNYTVTLADYTFYYRNYQYMMEQDALQNGYTPDTLGEFWDYEQDGVSMRQALSDNALSMGKQYAILYQNAVESGAKVSDEVKARSDAEVDDMLEELGGDESVFQETYHIGTADMKAMYNRLDLVQQYQDDLLSEGATQEELTAAYEEKKDQVTVRHILINTQNMSEQEKAEAKTRADELLRQLEDGADIGALAAEHSEDPGSRDNNGEYTFGRGMMVQPFEDWAYAAQDGDRGIVETDYGYHIMEMIGHVTADFEALKPELEQEIAYANVNAKMTELLADAQSPDWVVNQEVLEQVGVESPSVPPVAESSGG